MNAQMKPGIPPFRPRVADLWARIERQGGAWTTHRVLRAHRLNGHDALKRATARGDLHLLARAGLLEEHDEDPNRRFYTRKRTTNAKGMS
ncbi:hypothetical protein I5Q34_01195 [Streptomyces sp. AV19]|uniref:hypothetical protein n=1 Tax=Streptomyces sp. AV19 TaxID=2793068 RepID=UPI0018FE3A04|nr:hypothetical protein [Streptomyces sp. AV19]MBH1932920.1 hypothetical protein [Streptomyces sp. AV19]MDG4531670.1 hypothetical protein [Streptomyces sp. AV19]